MSASRRPIRRAAVVVAAGRGARAGTDVPKQFVRVAGKPVLQHTLDALARYDFDALVLVRPVEGTEYLELDLSGFAETAVTTGGQTRTGSVREGLRAADDLNVDRVFIHDGARPFVSSELLARLDVGLDQLDGVVPSLRMVDAIKSVRDGFLGSDLSREAVVRVQTPQAFSFLPIFAAYEAINVPTSDCAAVACASGMRVGTVEGEEANFKLTYPADFDRARQLLRSCP